MPDLRLCALYVSKRLCLVKLSSGKISNLERALNVRAALNAFWQFLAACQWLKSGQGCVCLLVSRFATGAFQPRRKQNGSALGLTMFPLFFLQCTGVRGGEQLDSHALLLLVSCSALGRGEILLFEELSFATPSSQVRLPALPRKVLKANNGKLGSCSYFPPTLIPTITVQDRSPVSSYCRSIH